MIVSILSCSTNGLQDDDWKDVAGAIKPSVKVYFRDYLLYILGAFHLIFTLWMAVEYFVVNYPNFILPLPAVFYIIFKRSICLLLPHSVSLMMILS